MMRASRLRAPTRGRQDREPRQASPIVKLVGVSSAADRGLVAITLARLLVARTLEEMGIVANDDD